MTGNGTSERVGAASIDDLIDARAVASVFQPLVHLASGEVVAYECLSRGPAGSPLAPPDAMFAAAAAAGRTGELDWVCRAGGLNRALASGAPTSLTWFVNVEPSGLTSPCPPDLAPAVRAAEERLRVVVEITEREVDRDPAGVLAAVAQARGSGWGVALDDVGADPRSLALLPFIQPDVVKLDLSLVQDRNASETAAISNAVRAYAESTGAVVLAEGIEDDSMAAAAQALGATYGQGWLFGRPAPLPMRINAPRAGIAFTQRVAREDATPFEVACRVRRPERATKDLLLPNSLHLERQALRGGETMVLLSTFQDGRHLTPGTVARYRRLGTETTFAAALGAGMPEVDLPGVRVVDLDPYDDLVSEWDVIVVGPHFAGALLARDCGDDGPDRDRRFDYVITHDRDLVLAAARSLLAWVTSADRRR